MKLTGTRAAPFGRGLGIRHGTKLWFVLALFGMPDLLFNLSQRLDALAASAAASTSAPTPAPVEEEEDGESAPAKSQGQQGKETLPLRRGPRRHGWQAVPCPASALLGRRTHPNPSPGDSGSIVRTPVTAPLRC
jgi:hypothetical protein